MPNQAWRSSVTAVAPSGQPRSLSNRENGGITVLYCYDDSDIAHSMH